ncbi:MAG: serine/threonine protein kinase, partial [Myxococcales bacterium]|nr:serine/threonine protein kinase [Myxococcales bacterium]
MSGDLAPTSRDLVAVATTHDKWIGATLAETYKVVSLLGEGGMGAVYRALHTRLPGAEFAVKVLTADSLKTGEAAVRFMREAEISVKLRHPHIVEVFDFNKTAEGDLYIVMEMLEGQTLYDRMHSGKRLGLGAVVEIVKQTASALAAAHKRGVIHRDLKPSNIFLCHHGDSERWVKVVDFGISKMIGSQNTLTGERRILGTPWYMSPEQVRGQSDLMDGRTDVFALGCIAYEMLCGRKAFDADSIATALYKVAHEAPPPIRIGNPAIPPAVEAVLMRALAKDLNLRTQSVDRFARELEQAIAVSRTQPDLEALPAQDQHAHAAAVAAAGLPSSELAPLGHYPGMTGPQLPAQGPGGAPLQTGRGFAPMAEVGPVTASQPVKRSLAVPIAIVVLGVGMGALAAAMILAKGKDPASGSASQATTIDGKREGSATTTATPSKATTKAKLALPETHPPDTKIATPSAGAGSGTAAAGSASGGAASSAATHDDDAKASRGDADSTRAAARRKAA